MPESVQNLRVLAVGIGLLVVVTVITAIAVPGEFAVAGLALLAGAACVLAVVLHRRSQRSARAHSAALKAISSRLDGLEKTHRTMLTNEAAAKSERTVLLRRMNALRSSILTDQQAIHQLMVRFQPEAPLPAVAGWALDPTALFWLIDHVDRARPKLVVECGCGASTLWIAMALRRNGSGRLVSLEHSGEFADKTRDVLRRHGLLDWVEVRTTGLAPVETTKGTFSWYDVDPTSLGEIDVLFVDGPPAATGRHARYPALPVLGGNLAPGAVVVLDDAERPDEREILDLWLAEDGRLSRYAQPGPETVALIVG